MEFLVTFKPQDISCSSLGFKRTQINKLTFLTENLSAPELSKLSEAYHGDRLFQEIKQITKNNFLLVLIDDQNEKLLIFNDHFATNEILYMRVEGTLLVSNRARLIFESIGRGPTLDEDAIYEFFHFFYISPPRSIYKGVKSLPAASCLVADARELSEGVTVKSYWSFEQECRPKIRKYDELVEGLREALFECIKQDLDEELAVSLSGGIDSGGVLALIGELEGKPVRSITIGPYGERSADLFSSRQTASELGSINTEIYPLKTDLLKLKECLQDVNQPLNGPVALSACLIFDKAKTLGVKQIYTGFGSGMMLGTQKENRLAYYLDKVEWLIPPVLRKHSYKTISRMFGFSDTKRDILLSDSWAQRHSLINSPLRFPDDFFCLGKHHYSLELVRQELEKTFSNKELGIVDRFMAADWRVRHIPEQVTAMCSLANNYSLKQISPFYTPGTAKVILKTPDRFRKLRGWDRQIIRDVFRPYISQRLGNRRAKSLIFPVDQWFDQNTASAALRYLSNCTPVRRFINLDRFSKERPRLKEPGYSLLQLLAFGVWYDTNWDKENVPNFEAIFDGSS